MSKNKRERIQQRNLQRKRKQKMNSLLYLVAGLAIVIGAWYTISTNGPAEATAFSPEDIIYGEELHAIHEMDGPSLASIPFLPKDQPQPKIAVSEDFYDFGTIGAQDIVTYEFVIQNVGEGPLTISRAYTTCGCTTADFTATVIPPGKAVVMTLTLDAGFHDVSGQTVKRGIIIENNDPHMPELEIWTQAHVANN